jgi:ribosome-binding protein aMBF1 (putative translation factor)
MSDPVFQDWTPVVFKKKTKQENTEEKQKTQAFQENSKLRKLENEDYVAPKPKIELKQFLQKARTARNLSQKELAVKINVTPATIQQWESGKAVIAGNSITALNKALKVNMKKQEIL